MVLITSAVAPTADTNTKSELTEIAAGNGYTANGYSLSRNTTDFDILTEDDTGDKGIIKIKDIVWTAPGGPIPASGNVQLEPVTMSMKESDCFRVTAIKRKKIR